MTAGDEAGTYPVRLICAGMSVAAFTVDNRSEQSNRLHEEKAVVSSSRAWLDVPYGEKDQAKRHGARWDPTAKRWFAPRQGLAALQRWAAQPELPDLLPGEDRSFGAGLFVDLVPTSCWFTNVRSCVDQTDWERLRRMITRRAGQRCELCQRPEDRDIPRWLEAHERWHYNNQTGVQTLRRLICLCTDCHRSSHYGLAELRSAADQAFDHLCVVTGMSPDEAEAHIADAFATWRQRSERAWTLNLDILTSTGIGITPPPAAGTRREDAARTTDTVRAEEGRPTTSDRRVPSPRNDGPQHTSRGGWLRRALAAIRQR